jgi:hypothetical protein
MTPNFLPHYPPEYPKIIHDLFIAKDGKIIFLGEKNLQVLKGYKAQVLRTKNHLLISITGLSEKSMTKILADLEPLKEIPEDV